jgi:hypothetical protein
MFLTIPVSVASGERSFSSLQPIKKIKLSDIKNNQDRLNSLAIMLIKSENTEKIDFKPF